MLISLLLIFLNYLLFGIDGFYFGKTSPEIIIQPIDSSFYITCSINLSETAGLDSSHLSLHYENYTIDPTQIMVLNASTILYTLHHAPLMKRNYTCKLNSTDIVGQTQVMIGHKPGRVSNFKCRSYNWEAMSCSFRDMDNTLPTSYKLVYRPTLDSGHYHECQLHSDFRRHRFCNIDNANTTYLQARKLFYFKLDSENVLGQFQEDFIIDNYASVIPTPPVNFRVSSTTSRSVELAWKLSAKFVAFPEDFVFQLNVTSEYEETKYFAIVANATSEMKLSVRNLKYAYTMYNATIRMRVAISENIEEMWSRTVELTFITGTRPPDRPPDFDAGGFHINDNHDLVVYWKHMPRNLQNGPGFRYGIESVRKNGAKMPFQLAMISNTMAKLLGLRDDEYEVRIYNANRVGVVADRSVLKIPARQRRLPFPKRLRKYFSNGEYTFEWEPPMCEMIDYTVFWCAAKSEMPNQCEPSQSIDFQHVERTVTHFKLRSNETVNFAVSANSATSTSGMVWVLCTSANSNDIGKVKTVWISKTTAHTIDLQWTVDCVDAAIVRGFNISFCPTESSENTPTNCSELAKYQVVNTTTTGIHRHTIEHLKPFTMYKVALSMISDTRRGPFSEHHFNRTLEAPPSEPLNLVVGEITNVTAELYWDRPDQINGALVYYEIWFNENKVKTAGNDKQVSQKYLLENLKSYTDYQILVQACTISCSKASNKVQIRTSVGIPSKVGQLQADGLSDESDAYIYWQMPEVKAGRLDYFEMRIEMIESGKALQMAEFKISGVQTACRVPYKTCDDYSKVKEFSIRPVNVLSGPHANTSEQLNELKANHTQGVVDCARNHVAIQRLLAKDRSVVLLAGDWSTPLTTHCSFNDDVLNIVVIILGVIALIGVIVLTFCIYRKIERMKNIAIILPEGLIDIIEPDGNNFERQPNKAEDETKLLPRHNCYERIISDKKVKPVLNDQTTSSKLKTSRKNDSNTLDPFITIPSTGEIQASRPMHVTLTETVHTSPVVYSTVNVTGPRAVPQANGYVDQRCLMAGSGYVTNFRPTATSYVDPSKLQAKHDLKISSPSIQQEKKKKIDHNQLSGYVKPQQLADFGHPYTTSLHGC